jgi:L-alanine-DL-glutamate epimerase-like enolase superfamily enzyme
MRVTVEALSVPTADPFVISSGTVHATRSILVRLGDGLGEGSCLPPVTKEDQPEALAAVLRFGDDLDALAATPVARAGVEMALLDHQARAAGQPLWRFLGGPRDAAPIETDITLPILEPQRLAELAAQWWARGFRKLKVKAGKNLDADLRALEAVVRVTPRAAFQPDANGGLKVSEALAYLEGARRLGAHVLCFEQPCATAEELNEVAARTEVPVIADESVKQVKDLEGLEVGGVNLKIAKSGGLLAARAIGLEAKRRGLKVMMGGMVETRLGMTAAAHLAASLGGVDFADLDTAFLLTEERFDGGYAASGATLTLPDAPGLAITVRRHPMSGT